jgi:hypothetical protein
MTFNCSNQNYKQTMSLKRHLQSSKKEILQTNPELEMGPKGIPLGFFLNSAHFEHL